MIRPPGPLPESSRSPQSPLEFCSVINYWFHPEQCFHNLTTQYRRHLSRILALTGLRFKYTDPLIGPLDRRSYGTAHRELIPETIHDTSQYANNRMRRPGCENGVWGGPTSRSSNLFGRRSDSWVLIPDKAGQALLLCRIYSAGTWPGHSTIVISG